MLKSSSFEKKAGKTSEKLFFGPNLHGKGVIMDHTQDERNFFLVEITKADHQLSESFDWVMNFFLSSVIFSVKKVSFPAKTAVEQWVLLVCSVSEDDTSSK